MALLEVDFRLTAGAFDLSVELELDAGVLVLFGPSGAGKSLTVSALAGLATPHEGRIVLGGLPLFDAAARVDVPTRNRRVGYVPQHHSLFPFRDVAENVAFGLPKPRRRRDDPLVISLLEELELTHLAASRPASLSGGERQRVAFARALAVEPKLLLLDEPFASIDRAGRRRVRAVLARILRDRAIPAVLVTHDPAEALELGDALVLFERGRTVASGTPAELLGASELVIKGAVQGREVDGAMTTVTLTDATVRGGAEVLQVAEDGRIHIRLPVPDASGR